MQIRDKAGERDLELENIVGNPLSQSIKQIGFELD
jgi:hypothetical protein